ncbi:hypothetical protein TNCV_1984281 [Trichonephila clavipes]|nr:hypothetical protein TNCV_1984281 [Trichonephila clavipes]
MTSHNPLDDFYRWMTVTKLEARQSQVEVARGFRGEPKAVSQQWNQFQTSDTFNKNVGQGHHRTTSAQDHYSALSARRHRRTTAPQHARGLAAVSERKISVQTVYRRLAEFDLYARRLVLRGLSATSNCKDQLLWS